MSMKRQEVTNADDNVDKRELCALSCDCELVQPL